MNLQTAQKITAETLGNKQDPDMVTFQKQWNETGRLKGWLVVATWDTLSVTLDCTVDYTRVVGDLSVVPDYVPGKH